MLFKGISATMKPNCKVLMKIMYLYDDVLNIYETLNTNMSPKLEFELPSSLGNVAFQRKMVIFCRNKQASIIVLETSFLV